MTDIDWRTASSLVGTEQARLVKLGKPQGEARKEAIGTIAELHGITYDELATGLGKFGAMSIGSGHPRVPQTCDADQEDGPSALYLAWITTQDYVPSDTALAHFSGYSRAAFGYARTSKAIPLGYEFERAEYNGWKVTKRPDQRPSIEQLKKEIEEFTNNLLTKHGYK